MPDDDIHIIACSYVAGDKDEAEVYKALIISRFVVFFRHEENHIVPLLAGE
jgi:hypothetical protein